jgi:hypothetical protein
MRRLSSIIVLFILSTYFLANAVAGQAAGYDEQAVATSIGVRR